MLAEGASFGSSSSQPTATLTRFYETMLLEIGIGDRLSWENILVTLEWLHVRVVDGSQKAVAKKNCIESLCNRAQPLKKELGLAWGHCLTTGKFYEQGNHLSTCM